MTMKGAGLSPPMFLTDKDSKSSSNLQGKREDNYNEGGRDTATNGTLSVFMLYIPFVSTSHINGKGDCHKDKSYGQHLGILLHMPVQGPSQVLHSPETHRQSGSQSRFPCDEERAMGSTPLAMVTHFDEEEQESRSYDARPESHEAGRHSFLFAWQMQ